MLSGGTHVNRPEIVEDATAAEVWYWSGKPLNTIPMYAYVTTHPARVWGCRKKVGRQSNAVAVIWP